jgi:hypothetical protein
MVTFQRLYPRLFPTPSQSRFAAHPPTPRGQHIVTPSPRHNRIQHTQAMVASHGALAAEWPPHWQRYKALRRGQAFVEQPK